MNDEALYTSPSTVKSLWQEYRIYRDRVEFATHLGTVSIPLDVIETVEVQESDVKGLMKGDLKLNNFRPAIKLDWANFVEHVVLDKSEGYCKRFLFTPENPAEFKEKLDRLLGESRK